MPVLPAWAKEFGASGFVYGLIQSGYAVTQFAFAPVWGRLSDRFGRRPILLTTVAGTSAALVWLGLAQSLEALFAARLLAGAFAANIGVASAYITDVTDDAERTRWMGLLGASFGIGFVLGPAIGALLVPFGHAVPMLFAGGLAAVNLVFAAVALPEPERRDVGTRSVGRFALLRDPAVRRICVAYLCFSLAVTQLENMFLLFMIDDFAFDARDVAFILVGMAVVMGGVQGGGMRALSARFSERTLVRAGAAMLAGSMALIPFSPTVVLMLLPLTVAAIGRGISQPSLMSLASFESDGGNSGAVLGTFQSMASLARIFGPAAGGFLYDLDHTWPFLLAAALMALVFLQSGGLREGARAQAGAS